MDGSNPKVAVITRTRCRPLLLDRAVRSVRNQRYTNYIHIIVNDGDNPDVRKYADDTTIIVPIHNPLERVEIPTNTGLKVARELGADLITLHDDDDTWSPEFLNIMVKELFNYKKEIPSVRGVICGCNRIYEKVEGNTVLIDYLDRHAPLLPTEGLLRISDIIDDRNNFTTLQFMYETSVLDTLHNYDETLPYGDWDFNLRFLSHFDIAIIPLRLANYHWRISGPDRNYLTSTDKQRKIAMYEQYMQNKYFREIPALGIYMSLHREIQELKKIIYESK